MDHGILAMSKNRPTIIKLADRKEELACRRSNTILLTSEPAPMTRC